MHDAVQFLNARCGGCGRGVALRSGRRRTERSFGQLATVHAEVGIENAAAEMAHHFVVNRLAGQHELVGNAVGLHEARAQRD